MSDRARNLVVGSLLGVLTLVLIGLVATAETPDDRVERIGTAIKCPVCQGESIANSPAQMATDMMDLVEERVAAGASDDEIIDELLSSFSNSVLLDPPASGSTLFLWLAPIAALAIGVAVIFWWRAHPGPAVATEGGGLEDETTPSTTNRRLVGGLIVIGGFALIVLIAGAMIQDRPATTSGAASVDVDNLDGVSNETMEAVIAANVDHPQVNGMRVALAERYFSAGDYRSAFPLYLQVAEDERSTEGEASTALIRLGWMAYDGNGEVETAVTLFDEALAIVPESTVALYLKGQVIWCGTGDNQQASTLFAEVLANPELSEETRSQVQSDFDLASAGQACT